MKAIARLATATVLAALAVASLAAATPAQPQHDERTSATIRQAPATPQTDRLRNLGHGPQFDLDRPAPLDPPRAATPAPPTKPARAHGVAVLASTALVLLAVLATAGILLTGRRSRARHAP